LSALVTLPITLPVRLPVQEGNLNEPIRVCQALSLVLDKYSFVYQNVQSSVGSTASMV